MALPYLIKGRVAATVLAETTLGAYYIEFALNKFEMIRRFLVLIQNR